MIDELVDDMTVESKVALLKVVVWNGVGSGQFQLSARANAE